MSLAFNPLPPSLHLLVSGVHLTHTRLAGNKKGAPGGGIRDETGFRAFPRWFGLGLEFCSHLPDGGETIWRFWGRTEGMDFFSINCMAFGGE